MSDVTQSVEDMPSVIELPCVSDPDPVQIAELHLPLEDKPPAKTHIDRSKLCIQHDAILTLRFNVDNAIRMCQLCECLDEPWVECLRQSALAANRALSRLRTAMQASFDESSEDSVTSPEESMSGSFETEDEERIKQRIRELATTSVIREDSLLMLSPTKKRKRRRPGTLFLESPKEGRRISWDEEDENTSPQAKGNPLGRKRWRHEELEQFVELLNRHGPGAWARIRNDSSGGLSQRDNVQLKDKWRNMCKSGTLGRNENKQYYLWQRGDPMHQRLREDPT